MIATFHIWPEQTYRFSTRKLLPSKKNRFSKKDKPTIPFGLIKANNSNIQKMKEITVVARGSSFDLNDIKKIKGPIFLVSFWSPLKIDLNGKIFYTHYFSYDTGKFSNDKHQMTPKDLNEYLSDRTNNQDYKNKNIFYCTTRPNVMELLKKNGHKILCVEVHKMKENRNYLTTFPTTPEYLNFIDNDSCKRISITEKIYRPPLLPPHPDWAPSGSLLPTLCALSYFAEVINVYGWDSHLDYSPNKMSYWSLLFNAYKYKADVFRWNAQFEHSLINFYYGYQFSKLPNININGYMGQLSKHEKLIGKIEKVLFN